LEIIFEKFRELDFFGKTISPFKLLPNSVPKFPKKYDDSRLLQDMDTPDAVHHRHGTHPRVPAATFKEPTCLATRANRTHQKQVCRLSVRPADLQHQDENFIDL
jgi:hypothetical protein